MRETSGERIGCTRVKGEISSCKIFFFIVKFACSVEASPFVADSRILIVLFYFFFLFAASRGIEKILGANKIDLNWPRA